MTERNESESALTANLWFSICAQPGATIQGIIDSDPVRRMDGTLR